MGQIVRRKKKGRPSKADLARRSIAAGGSPTTAEPEIRRSHRRRNVKYNIDYDDYLEEDDEDEEDDERRREKKLKLVVKLSHEESSRRNNRTGERGDNAPESGSDDEDEDDDNGGERNRKKRRINGGAGDDEDDENDVVSRRGGDGDGDEEEEEEERGGKVDSKRLDSVPGTPTEPQSGIPLPEKKTLELILDKLQKKDTYGVYAEPVDREELPDYHDVIEHPMDFATVRKKLANGSYTTLEQFESDVFLICSNAMQYNSPETIYHKQARAIQELGKKKFEKLRIRYENFEKELKLAQKIKSNSMVKKPIKKPLYRTSQEAVASDFSSGATLATAGDVQNSLNPAQGGGSERPGNNDGPIEGNSSLNDANLEKAEETYSAKSLLSKLGRKPANFEENRRATYNISSQPVVRSESVFTTFESEIKQLVAVGLHAEYAYARSLARFAAALGPIAWKVASQRIEQALPAGCKFGRGWVGEYEPLPTPVLMLENYSQKQCNLVTKHNPAGEMRKDDRGFKASVPIKEQQTAAGPFTKGRQSLFAPAGGPQAEVKPSAFTSTGPQSEAKPSGFNFTGPQLEAKPSAFVSAGMKSTSTVNAIHQQPNVQSRSFSKPEIHVPKQVELNSLPAFSPKNADHTAEKKVLRNPEAAASKLKDTTPRHTNLPQSVPFKLPDSNGVVAGGGGLPNGKDTRNSLERQMSSPSDGNQLAKGRLHFHHGQEQGLTDPVQLMKMMAEKTQKQQKSSDQSTVDTQQAMPSMPTIKRDDSNNAAAAAARAWMSIGAGPFKQPTENPMTPKSQISADSLYNPARESQSQMARIRGEFPVSATMQYHPEKNHNFPVPAFFPQHVRMWNEAHFQNRPIMFPQLAAADLSRFQMQSPWRALSPHSQPRQKQDTLPPDLNIGFQSPGSPVRQSSGVMVESQQPDLALQL